MKPEERKSLIYNTVKSYQKLSHNELWKHVKQNFVVTDSFAKQTFERALLELVEENMIKREPDPWSNLGKVNYSPILDFKEIDDDIIRHFKTLMIFYEIELKKFSKKYGQLSVYDRALMLSMFHSLIFYVKIMYRQYKLIFNKNRKIKALERLISKLEFKLNSLSSHKNKLFTQEVNQLLIKNLEIQSQKILDELQSKKN